MRRICLWKDEYSTIDWTSGSPARGVDVAQAYVMSFDGRVFRYAAEVWHSAALF